MDFEEISKLAVDFGLFKFLYGFVPVNWVPVGGRTNVEADRKMMVYLIAPMAFGTKFPNRLLAKCAEHVRYGRNGPFDPYSHSLGEEIKLLEMLNKVHTFMMVMKSVPSHCVYQTKYNLDTVLKMKNPEDVINFGKQKCIAFLGMGDWLIDDALVLVYVVTLLLVFDDDFREEAFNEILTCGADNIFDAALTIESADRAVRNGNLADGLELYTRALKLNPLNDKIYNKLSQMYCKTGKYEFGRWFAVRSVWLLPYEAENHLQWLRSVEMIPDMTVAAMKFAQLIYNCGKSDKKFKKVEALTDIEATFQRLRFRVLGTVVCGMTTEGYPQSVIAGHEFEEKKWADLRYVMHAFTELFGFVPLQWIQLYPALQPHDRMYNADELELLHINFVNLISPFAFGVNYPNANLAKCAEYVNIFRKEPIKHSIEVEMETIALVRFAQSFLIFNKQTSDFAKVSKKNVKKVLHMSEPHKLIEFGKSMITEIFNTSIKWIDNDKAVFLYVVSLMMSQFKVFADDAFNDHDIDIKTFHYACKSNLAKVCMQRKDYEEALSLYSQGLQHFPRDSVVLGNMAQVYLCIGKYEIARHCALRSIWGAPFIIKNYYRWIKATDMLGQSDDLLRICSSINSCFDAGGYFGEKEHCIELELMCSRLCLKVSNGNTSNTQETKKTEESVQGTGKLNDSHITSKNVKPDLHTHEVDSTSKVFVSTTSKTEASKKTKETVHAAEERNNVAVSVNNGKPKRKPGRVESPAKERVQTKAKIVTQSTPKVVSSKNKKDIDNVKCDEVPNHNMKDLCDSFSTYQKYLHDGSDYFVKSVYKLAVENYSSSLQLVCSLGSEALKLSDIDVILLKYCYGKACIERNSHEHIRISIELFDEIIDQNCVSFPMAYYGKGLAFYRLNNFSEALIFLEKCLEIISKCIHFEAYLYPGLPTEVINESYQDKLKELVDVLVMNCRTPPVPDGICCNTECAFSSKIYCNDVEFLGYSRLTCHDKCHVEFHPVCWKGFVTTNKFHGDKDIIGRPCCTPDCKSFIAKLELIGLDGLVRKMLPEPAELKPKQSKNLVKPKNKQAQKEVPKQVIKKRVRVDSSSDIRDALEERRSSSSEKEQLDKVVTSYPDMRNAENALLILKKLDDNSQSKQPTKKLVSNTEKKNKTLKCQFDYKFVDRDRICALRAQRAVAEATTNDYFSVRLDPDSPFAVPLQEAQSNPLVLETYLRRSEPSNPSNNVTDEVFDINVLDCDVLKRSVLEYVEQYVIANGPVSITSLRFVDEINSFPTEVQELILCSGGIRTFLSASRLLFIGGVALMRENLKEITSGSLCLRSLDVACCDSQFLKMSSGSRLKSALSVPNFIEGTLCNFLGYNETSSVDPLLTVSLESGSTSHVDSFSNCDEQLDVRDEDDTDKDENCNDLKPESEFSLVEELQLYKDKLFGLRKEMSVTITQLKNQLEEVQEINEASQTKIKELENDCVNLKKKLTSEKQNAKQEVLALQTKLADQESEAGKISMDQQEISNKEKRQRLKLEGDVDTLTKTLAAMESNHDSLVKENRELKERISSLEMELVDEVEKSKMAEAAKDPKKPVEISQQTSLPLYFNVNNPYYSHPKLGAPQFYSSFPVQYQPIIRPLMNIRPSSSLENLSIRPVTRETRTAPSPVKTNKLETSTSRARPMSFTDCKQPTNVKKPRRRTSSFTSSPDISDTAEKPVEIRTTENCPPIAEALEGCSFSYAAKAAVQKKVVPQTQKTMPETQIFGCSEYVNRIFDQVKKQFPRMQKSEFLTYLQLVRSTNKNSLSGLKLKVIVSRVCKEAQDWACLKKRSHSTSVSSRGSESLVELPNEPGPSFWSDVMGSKTGAKPKKKIGEDVCSICLCDIIECDAHFLQCSARHVFHKKCIREWYFKGEESCPLCRESAPLHEEFPTLNY